MSTYELGEIIRWKSSPIEEFDYGMVIKRGQVITSGVYSLKDRLTELVDSGDIQLPHNEALLALTVYSFREQRVVTIYRSPEDLPLYIEKVKFSKKNT